MAAEHAGPPPRMSRPHNRRGPSNASHRCDGDEGAGALAHTAVSHEHCDFELGQAEVVTDAKGWLLLAVLVVIIVSLVPVLLPEVSRRRGAKRARRAGAVWVGLANFDGLDVAQADVVRQALADVGDLYGASLSPARRQRPVGGLLWVFRDRICWEPRIWLGRGKARSWQLDARTVLGVTTAKVPPPAIRAYRAVLHTREGDIRFGIVDPQGLEDAIHRLQRR